MEYPDVPAEPHTLSSLPLEIRLNIASFLNQIDALSLAKTGKALFDPCFQRIYDFVVVDACYTQFSTEYSPHLTYINSSYSLKQYFKALGRSKTRFLHVMCLPDSTNIYNVEIQQFMTHFISGLANLREFVWQCENFTFEQLYNLPNPHLLKSLKVNISHASLASRLEQSFGFQNLRNLQIRPFANQKRLVNLLGCILEGKNELDSLDVARFDSDSPALIPAREINNLGQSFEDSEPMSADIETNTLDVVVKSNFAGNFRHLSELCLNSILVSEHDAISLKETVHLPHLTTLKLKNIAEFGFSSDRTPTEGFLGLLSPHLINLAHLHLDYRETGRDTIVDFLQNVPFLKSLDLTVRMNAYKKRYVDETQLYSEIGTAISAQRNLKTLSLELRREHSFCEIVMPTPQVMLTGLAYVTKLKSLRLACVEMHAHEAFNKSVSRLKDLRFLHVFGVNTVPNLGLGMVHPNIYDEWFKVSHFAQEYLQIQRQLRYVRINECVFESDGDIVHPRDTIDRWFENIVRV
ncbi:hypothetical protein OXX79_009678 [Metschnikowia pulcherrima]